MNWIALPEMGREVQSLRETADGDGLSYPQGPGDNSLDWRHISQFFWNATEVEAQKRHIGTLLTDHLIWLDSPEEGGFTFMCRRFWRNTYLGNRYGKHASHPFVCGILWVAHEKHGTCVGTNHRLSFVFRQQRFCDMPVGSNYSTLVNEEPRAQDAELRWIPVADAGYRQ